jgi:hypothetical protein
LGPIKIKIKIKKKNLGEKANVIEWMKRAQDVRRREYENVTRAPVGGGRYH